MLEKPNLADDKIITCVKHEYGLAVAQITFLPLGADVNTAVYRLVTEDQTPYFLKLRSGIFNEAAVRIPKFLSDSGVKQVIPSLNTCNGELWATLDAFKVILYPFIDGHNAFELNLSNQQRAEFGAALKQLHTAEIPLALTHTIPRETFSSHCRETVKAFLKRIETETFTEPAAVKLATFLKSKRLDILALIGRSAQLALALQTQAPEFILCHGDIHGWNLLIDTYNALYIVDWDTLTFAPKERDLMFVGLGLGGRGHSLAQEEALFYEGYGPTRIDPIAIAYYRYERIIEDIAAYCAQIFLSDEGGQDREQAIVYLQSNFLPNGTIAMAYQADKTNF